MFSCTKLFNHLIKQGKTFGRGLLLFTDRY